MTTHENRQDGIVKQTQKRIIYHSCTTKTGMSTEHMHVNGLILFNILKCVLCKNKGETWRVQSGDHGYSKCKKISTNLKNVSLIIIFSPAAVSDIPWYAWLVLSIKILLLVGLIGFGVYKLVECL